MGFKFSLVLSREITDDEKAALRKAGCASAIFTTDSLPTNADVAVTRMDFDDTTSPSLAEAIESALAAVKETPELSVPGLTVPAQPAERTEASAEEPAAEPAAVVAEQSSAKAPSARKPGTRRASVKKTAAESAGEPVTVPANGHAAADLVDVAAKSD